MKTAVGPGSRTTWPSPFQGPDLKALQSWVTEFNEMVDSVGAHMRTSEHPQHLELDRSNALVALEMVGCREPAVYAPLGNGRDLRSVLRTRGGFLHGR